MGIKEKKFISMQEASKLCSYSQEYLSLLARRGKIFSKKIGRNWYTTKDAIEEYIGTQKIVVVIPKRVFGSKLGSRAKPIIIRTENSDEAKSFQDISAEINNKLQNLVFEDAVKEEAAITELAAEKSKVKEKEIKTDTPLPALDDIIGELESGMSESIEKPPVVLEEILPVRTISSKSTESIESKVEDTRSFLPKLEPIVIVKERRDALRDLDTVFNTEPLFDEVRPYLKFYEVKPKESRKVFSPEAPFILNSLDRLPDFLEFDLAKQKLQIIHLDTGSIEIDSLKSILAEEPGSIPEITEENKLIPVEDTVKLSKGSKIGSIIAGLRNTVFIPAAVSLIILFFTSGQEINFKSIDRVLNQVRNAPFMAGITLDKIWNTIEDWFNFDRYASKTPLPLPTDPPAGEPTPSGSISSLPSAPDRVSSSPAPLIPKSVSDPVKNFVPNNITNVSLKNVTLPKIFDSLEVAGNAFFKKDVTLTEGNLNINKGTIIISNKSLIKNLNSEYVGGLSREDIIALIQSNGATITYIPGPSSGSSGGSSSGGSSNNAVPIVVVPTDFNKLTFFNAGLWAKTGSFGSLGVAGDTTIGNSDKPEDSTFQVYSKKFRLNSDGDLTVSGDTTLSNLKINNRVESDLIPSGSQNFGSSSSRWQNVYAVNTYFSGTASAAYVYAQSGTAASPSFAFTVDQDTGFFRPAPNQLAISTLGSERVRINADGNVGIGSTAPTALFDLVGNVSGTSTSAILRIASTSELFRVQENGNVGINSGNNLDVKFEVGGAASISGNLFVYGNIGIGTTTVPNQLTVVGSGSFTGQLKATRNPSQAHTGTWPSFSNTDDSTFLINPSSPVADGNIIAYVNGSNPKFLVDAEGDVYAAGNLTLVGTTTQATTTVTGDLTVEGNARLGDAVTDVIKLPGTIRPYTATSFPVLIQATTSQAVDVFRIRDTNSNIIVTIDQVSGQVAASSGFNFALGLSTATTSYSRLGTSATTHSNYVSQPNDLLISGDLSVIGTASFGSFASISNTVFFDATNKSVGIGTTTISGTALLDLTSTTKGFLPPRVTTTQRDNISSPATGLTVYNTTLNKMNIYNGTSWKNVGSTEIGGEVTSGTAGSVLFVDASSNLGQDNSNFYWDDTNNRLGIGTTGPATKLEVQGTASASYLLTGNTLQVGGFSSAAYSRFGTATATSALLSTTNDLLISGDLETDGSAFFDGAVSISGNFQTAGRFVLGDNGDTGEINTSDWDISSTGAITGVAFDANGTGNTLTNIDNADLTADTLDFTAILDNPTLDADLNISRAGFKIGLGAAPQTVFEVQGTASASYLLAGSTLQVGGFSSAAYSRFGTGTTSEAHYINGANDLFITGDLEVDGSVSFAGPASISNALYVSTLGKTGNVGIGTFSPIGLLDVNTKLVVLSGGNVGIGSTSPTALLQISSSSGLPKQFLSLVGSGGTNWAAWMGSDAVNSLYIGGSGSQNDYFWRANWSTSGVAANTFQAASTVDNSLTVLEILQKRSGNTGDYLHITSNGATSGNIFTVANSGNVGIKTTTPQTLFEVQGTASASYLLTGNTLQVGGFSSAAYSRFGTGTATSSLLSTTNDLLISGDLETDGSAFFDGAVSISGNFQTAGRFILGDNGDTGEINTSDWDISTTGAITGIAFDANGTGNSLTNVDNADLTNDTLDFDKILDNPTLDASLNISRAGFFVGIGGAPQTTFEVQGTASASYLLAGSTLQVGGFSSAAYSRFGTGTATNAVVSTTNDLLISGDLETDGSAFFDGAVSISGNFQTAGRFVLGDNGDTGEINTSDWDISSTGAITGVAFDANGTGNSLTNIDNADLTNDTLDFDKILDNPTLDASLNISRAGFFVGIGGAPQTTFEVQGTASASYFLTGNTIQVGGFASAAYNRFGTGTTSEAHYITGSDDLLISGDLEVDGSVSFAGPASISSTLYVSTLGKTGNVGVGATAPAYKLDVRNSGGSQLHFSEADADSGGYLTSDGAHNFFVSTGAAWNNASWVAKSTGAVIIGGGAGGTAGLFTIYTDASLTAGNTFGPSERLRIDSAGNVGIGTTTINNRLTISGSSDISGQLGVGTTTPQTKLEVQGTASASYLLTGNTLQVGGFASAAYSRFGTATAGNAAITTTNDVLISGDLELDGSAFFDGAVSISGNFQTAGRFVLGDNGDTGEINTSDWDISSTGAITGVAFDANGTGNSLTNVDNADLTNDTLDFDKILDNPTLDASLNISRAGFFVGIGGAPQTTFEVQGTASASYLLTGNTLQVGGFASVAYSRFGTATTTHAGSITTTNDLLISGDLEVDASVAFDGIFKVASGSIDRFTIASNGNTTFNGGQDGALQTWSCQGTSANCGNTPVNAKTLPASVRHLKTVIANGYIYAIGGTGASGNVYYAKLNSNGTTDTWSTNANALPSSIAQHDSVVVNGYIYVIGGNNGAYLDTVYYAKINSDGSTGAWQTNANVLPVALLYHSAVTANGYIYVLGGEKSDATFSAKVYYAKVNPDGSTGAWTTNTNDLPATNAYAASAVANGYVYIAGGYTGSAKNAVYYGKLNANGSVAAFSTNANNLPAARIYSRGAAMNNYLYVIGGDNPLNTPQSTVYYGLLNADGSVSAFSTNANALPDERSQAGSAVANGYVYIVGGTDGVAKDTVIFASAVRLRMLANLDLLTLASASFALGDSNPSIYAGNVNVVNNLEVSGNTQLWNGLALNGPFTLNGVGLATRFEVQGTASASYLLTGNTLQVGGFASAAYSRFGTATAGNAAITTTNDVLISGDLELDGSAFFDGAVSISGNFQTAGRFVLGDNGDTGEINTSDWDISSTGAITGVAFDANGTGNSLTNIDNADLTNDTLDFDKILDNPTLDASLNISRAGFFVGIGGAPQTTFEVQGTASASYLLAGSTLQVGGFASAAYNRFGTATTTHAGSITTTNDLLISGDLEVDASAAFDGIVRMGAGPAFYTDGTDVGIGIVASSSWRLTLNDANSQLAIRDSDNGKLWGLTTANNADLYFFENALADANARLTLAAGGNIGIGTVSPLFKLHVRSDTAGSTVSSALTHADNTNGASHARLVIQTGGTSGGDPYILYSIPSGTEWSAGVDNSDSDKFKIARDDGGFGLNDRLTILTTGQTGINDSTPDAFFDVAGSGLFDNELIVTEGLQVGGATSVAYSRFGTTTTTHSNYISASNDVLISGDLEGRGSLSFAGTASLSNAFWVSPGGYAGNVGIGTTKPKSKLFVDVSFPTTTTGTKDPGSTLFTGIAVAGTYIYATGTGGTNDLVIFEASNPASISVESTFNEGGSATFYSIVVKDKYAYVGDYTNAKIYVFDVSNPKAPVNLINVSAATNIWRLYIQGRYLYAVNAGGTKLLEIFDISNPTNPISVGSTSITDAGYAVQVQGKYAYVATQVSSTTSLRIFNVANPTSPYQVGSLTVSTTLNDYPRDLYVQGRYAYVIGEGSNKLYVVNISNPANPTNIANIATTDTGLYDIYAQKKYLYVSSPGTVEIFDVSIPHSPVSLGAIIISGANAEPISVVQGRYLYQVDGSDAVFSIFDLGGAYIQQAEFGGIETGTLTINSTGYVGHDFGIRGGLNVGQGAYISGPFSVYASASRTAFSINNNGNVGINTIAPQTLFEVQGTASASYLLAGSTLQVGGFASVAYSRFGTGTATAAHVTTTNDVLISGDLEVAGSISLGNFVTTSATHVCRNSTSKYLGGCSAHVSEWYPVLIERNGASDDDLDNEYEGVIVSISNAKNVVNDSTAVNFAKLSEEPYDSNVLGIISSIKGGANGDRKSEYYLPLTLAGRVPIKVSLENGPIKAGDRLTSSSSPGVSMKAARSGMTVAVALEDLDSISSGSYGKILAFVNLSYWEPTVNENKTDGGSSASISFAPDLPASSNAIVQVIQSIGNIVEGIKKTAYGVQDVFNWEFDWAYLKNIWQDRKITISPKADLEAVSQFSGAGAQGAQQSKLDLEGDNLATYGVDSTRGEIQLSGASNLVGGEAKVYFDFSFSSVISDKVPIKVIVTPSTNIQSPLYVAAKSPFGFVVRQSSGTNDGQFDWLVIARRRGYDTDSTQTNADASPTPSPSLEPSLSILPDALPGSSPIPDSTPESQPSPEASAGTATPEITPEPSIEPSSSPAPEETPSSSTEPTSTPPPSPKIEEESPSPTPSPSSVIEPTPEISESPESLPEEANI